MGAQIFISHSSKDRQVARTICTALEGRKLSCWIASRDVRPGENFMDSIVDAINSAEVMVLVFSENANNSDEIKREIVLAGNAKIPVIPVRVEDVAPKGAFAYQLATRQWIDLFEDWESEIERLAASIGLVVSPETGAAAGAERAAVISDALRVDAAPALEADAEGRAAEQPERDKEAARGASQKQEVEAQRLAEQRRHEAAEAEARARAVEAAQRAAAVERSNREAERARAEMRAKEPPDRGRAELRPQEKPKSLKAAGFRATFALAAVPWRKVETLQQARAMTIVGVAVCGLIAVAAALLVLVLGLANEIRPKGVEIFLGTALLFAACGVGTYFNFRSAAAAGFAILTIATLWAVWLLFLSALPGNFLNAMIAGILALTAFAGVRGTFAFSKFTRALNAPAPVSASARAPRAASLTPSEESEKTIEARPVLALLLLAGCVAQLGFVGWQLYENFNLLPNAMHYAHPTYEMSFTEQLSAFLGILVAPAWLPHWLEILLLLCSAIALIPVSVVLLRGRHSIRSAGLVSCGISILYEIYSIIYAAMNGYNPFVVGNVGYLSVVMELTPIVCVAVVAYLVVTQAKQALRNTTLNKVSA